MARFKKSSSSEFVFVTRVMLLLAAVIINIYPAPAAAAAASGEEVAKDQHVHHHEIQGRVLVGVGFLGKIFSNTFKSGARTSVNGARTTVGNRGTNMPGVNGGGNYYGNGRGTYGRSPRGKDVENPPDYSSFNSPVPPSDGSTHPQMTLDQYYYYQYLDKTYCHDCQLVQNADGSIPCKCYIQHIPSSTNNNLCPGPVAHCCQAMNGVCHKCCPGENHKCCPGENGPRGDVYF